MLPHNNKMMASRAQYQQPSTPVVSTILLNWNGKDDTLECLESLQNVTYANLRIIVVDNASIDGLLEIVENRFPDVTVIRNSQNLGFAEGNNVGIRYALEQQNPDYILLLNNDTVVEPPFLSYMVDIGEQYSEIGMLAPLIYWHDQPDKIWFYSGFINWHNGYCDHHKLPDKLSFTTWLAEHLDPSKGYLENSHYLSGCALLVKSELIRQIGLLDARFFAYYEDVDWSVRCLTAGWKLAVVPQAKIWHKVASLKQSSFNIFLSYRNIILFLWKHSTFFQRLLRIKRHIYRTLAEYSWDKEEYYSRHDLIPLDGAWAGLTGRYGAYAEKMPHWMHTCVYYGIRYLLWLFRYPK